MNPMTAEVYEGFGDANSLLLIIGWFFYLLAAYGVSNALYLSYKNSLRLWAICNAAPIVILAVLGHFSFLPFIGLSIMAWFSYVMGGAVFDNREKERMMKQRFLDEINEKVEN